MANGMRLPFVPVVVVLILPPLALTQSSIGDPPALQVPPQAASAPCSAALPPPVVPGPNISEYSARRENALAAAEPLARCHDYEGALRIYLKVLESYPNDARALNIAGMAAVRAGHIEESIPLFQRALAQAPNYSWSVRASLMHDFIALNRWQDFEAERLDTRKASLAGDKTLPPEDGYQIDTLKTGNEFIRVIEFPALHGQHHTRDRFQLYEEKDPCTGFTPYIDLESDDVDQADFDKRHPDKATAGDRSFSLDSYPTPNSQALIKFYADGEPAYETVRADILAALKQPLTAHHNQGETCASSDDH